MSACGSENGFSTGDRKPKHWSNGRVRAHSTVYTWFMFLLRAAGSWVKRHARVLAALLTIGGLTAAIASQRTAIASFDWHIDPGALLGALALLAVAPIVQAISFWMTLHRLDAHAELPEAAVIWTRGYLLRYAPT